MNLQITSKVKSFFSDKQIPPENHIVELICDKLAKKKGLVLFDGFWKDEPWKKYYRFQISIAYKLCRIYSPQAVISALKDKKCYALSLTNKRLDGLIKKYHNMEKPTKAEGTNFEVHIKTERGKLKDI